MYILLRNFYYGVEVQVTTCCKKCPVDFFFTNMFLLLTGIQTHKRINTKTAGKCFGL